MLGNQERTSLIAPLSLFSRRPATDWGLHSDPGWTRALKGHLQTWPRPLHAALPHYQWVWWAQNLPFPPVRLGLCPCPRGQHLRECEQRKGAIKLEPRASIYLRSSNSGFGNLSVSLCLKCKILWVFLHFLSCSLLFCTRPRVGDLVGTVRTRWWPR